MKTRSLCLPFLLILLFAGGCSALTQLSAFNSPTEVPTRTPRPTFTPRPPPTDIPTATNTLVAPDTPAPTDTPKAEDTATSAPVAVKTPRPVLTATPPPPAKPAFPIALGSFGPGGVKQLFCPNEASVYEVIVNAKLVGTPPRQFAKLQWFGAFGPAGLLSDYGGKPLVTQTDNGGMSGTAFGYNCGKTGGFLNPDRYNGKLDLADVVRQGTKTIVIRFVRSQSDLTANSPDVSVNFDQSGTWFLYFDVQP